MTWSLDRRVGACALGVAVCVVGSALVAGRDTRGVGEGRAASSVAGSERTPRSDAEARADLIRLFTAGNRATYQVVFRFRRRLADGRELPGITTELQRPPDHLTSSFGELTGQLAGKQVVCSQAGERVTCDTSRPATDDAVGPLVSLAEVTSRVTRVYVVQRAPDRSILGETARCFRLVWTGRFRAAPYGLRSEYCLAADGVPLRVAVERAGSKDVQEAQTVKRSVTDADVKAFVAPYG